MPVSKIVSLTYIKVSKMASFQPAMAETATIATRASLSHTCVHLFEVRVSLLARSLSSFEVKHYDLSSSLWTCLSFWRTVFFRWPWFTNSCRFKYFKNWDSGMNSQIRVINSLGAKENKIINRFRMKCLSQAVRLLILFLEKPQKIPPRSGEGLPRPTGFPSNSIFQCFCPTNVPIPRCPEAQTSRSQDAQTPSCRDAQTLRCPDAQ